MKEVIHSLSGDEFTGTATLRVPKRAERSTLQLEAMKAGEQAKDDPSVYFKFSERLLDEYVVAIDAVHIESGEAVKSRDDLFYIQAEKLISELCQVIVGGQKLGKATASL